MIRRSAFMATCVCVGAIALTACSLLLGEGFTDPEEPAADSGGGDAPSVDGTSTTDGSSGGVDSALTDSAPENDAGSDATCPSGKASFCDDFERDTPQGAWDTMTVNSDGTLAVANSGGNRRLASSITAVGGSAQLSRGFSLTPAKVHLETSLTIAKLPASGGVYITGVSMLNGASSPSLLYVYANPSGVYFVEQVTDNLATYKSSILTFTLGAQHRIVIDVTFGAKAVVSVDGTTQVDKAAESYLVAKPPNLYIGAGSLNGTDLALTFDDFVFTLD